MSINHYQIYVHNNNYQMYVNKNHYQIYVNRYNSYSSRCRVMVKCWILHKVIKIQLKILGRNTFIFEKLFCAVVTFLQ